MKRLFIMLFLLLAVAVALGVVRSLAPGVGSGTGYPEIVSFKATPRVISLGDSSVLSWETRGTTSLAMEWTPERAPRGNMQRVTGLPPSGTMTVQPKEDTVYVLVCETPSDSTCASMSVTVQVR